MSWKKELKDYLVARTRHLNTQLEEVQKGEGTGKNITERLEEVNNVAANFGIKIKKCED